MKPVLALAAALALATPALAEQWVRPVPEGRIVPGWVRLAAEYTFGCPTWEDTEAVFTAVAREEFVRAEVEVQRSGCTLVFNDDYGHVLAASATGYIKMRIYRRDLPEDQWDRVWLPVGFVRNQDNEVARDLYDRLGTIEFTDPEAFEQTN